MRLTAAAVWLTAIAAAGTWMLGAGLGPAEAATRLVDGLRGSAWGPPAFVAVYLARPLIFFSAAVLTVAGGFLFGAWLGIALVLVAANGSALVAYGLARWLGAGALAGPHGTGRLRRAADAMRARSFETVLLLRLLYAPYDVVSYLAGALRIRLVPFVVATAVGSAPATVAFVLFGASLERFSGGVPSLDTPVLVTSGALLAAGLGVAAVLRRRGHGDLVQD